MIRTFYEMEALAQRREGKGPHRDRGPVLSKETEASSLESVFLNIVVHGRKWPQIGREVDGEGSTRVRPPRPPLRPPERPLNAEDRP